MKKLEAMILARLFEARIPFPAHAGDKAMDNLIATLLTIRRLALKHRRLAEMSCNGEGVIRGVHYYGGTIDDYARREYELNVKTSHVGGDKYDERDVFDVESDKVEAKIKALCAKIGFDVEFQGDPRGATVKLAYKGRYVEIF